MRTYKLLGSFIIFSLISGCSETAPDSRGGQLKQPSNR